MEVVIYNVMIEKNVYSLCLLLVYLFYYVVSVGVEDIM